VKHRFSFGIAAIVLTLSATACSSSDPAPAGKTDAGGDAKADTGSTTTDSGKSETTPSETGGGGDCTGILMESDCATCVESNCCDLLSQCNDTPNCLECLTGSAGTDVDCTTVAHVMDLGTCVQGKCDVCTPKSDCNPVTGAECTTAGATCDLASGGVYTCFDPPNDAVMCGACDNSSMSGPFCGKGLACNEKDHKCTSYCCDDADCGSSGKCDKTMVPGGVGHCVTADGNAVCDAPATAPSGGSCFMP
jgi:hypothetical protein